MKMRGNRKNWGRCPIHGQGCEMCNEIRASSIDRNKEKREANQEVLSELENSLEEKTNVSQ